MTRMNETRNTKGRLVDLHAKAFSAEIRVMAASCDPPCHCEGYEVCLHLLGPNSRIPVWPVFSAASPEEAREIQRQIVLLARSFDVSKMTRYVEMSDGIAALLKAWAALSGFHKPAESVAVWRREGREGRMGEENSW